MGKSIRVLICLLLGMGILWSSAVSASDALKVKGPSIPEGMPEIISLLEETPLYWEPNEKAESGASLSPQDVKVLGTQNGDRGFTVSRSTTWIRIHTSWLGDMWIHVSNMKLGVIQPLELELELASETPLYSSPFPDAYTGASLSPQTVRANGQFVSPSGFYAVRIATSWLGDQWLIQPSISNGKPVTTTYPDAINPDYGQLMAVKDLRLIRLKEKAFIQGTLRLEKEAWNVGRLHFGNQPDFPVSGYLSFWNESSTFLTSVPYAAYTQAGESSVTPILIPVEEDAISGAVAAILQNTSPIYYGLPVPPSLTHTDPEKKVLLGVLRFVKTGEYSIAKAWISGRLAGLREYKLTVTFYGEKNEILGSAPLTIRLHGPNSPQEAGAEGGGTPYLINFIGLGDWEKYREYVIRVDHVSEALTE